jgi:hypothetical protein
MKIYAPPEVIPPSRGAMLTAALAYARMGFPVFPTLPRRKRPMTKHGVHAATRNEVLIRQWWEKVPHANVAIATGAHLVVIDVDVKNGSHGLDSFMHLLRVMKTSVRAMVNHGSKIVLTPSSGFHIWIPDYAGNPPPSRNFRNGLEIKAEGVYVLAPPSVTWLTERDRELGGYRPGTPEDIYLLLETPHPAELESC